MKRRGLKLTAGHRWTLYSVSLLLFLSGAAWAWADHLEGAASASTAWRDFKPWLLKTHGLSAMAFVLLLGTLLPGHVRRAWRARKNRGQGTFFLAAVSVLTCSGYFLYYLGDENWRNAFSQFHLWLGVISPILMAWHIWSGRAATK